MKLIANITFLPGCIVVCLSYLISCEANPLLVSNGNDVLVIEGTTGLTPSTGVTSGHVAEPLYLLPAKHHQRKRAISPLVQPEIHSVRIHSEIKYRYSRTHVSSTVANRDTQASQEVTFTVVLPETAFISKFVMEIDNVSYTAYVKEKVEAKKIYARAQHNGQTAGLLEMSARNSDAFNVNVNIKAGSEVKFNLTYEELLSRKLGKYEQLITFSPTQARSVKDFQIAVNIEESQNITLLKVQNLRNDLESELDSERNDTTSINGNKASILWRPNRTELGIDKGNFLIQYDINRTSTSGEILLMEGYFVHFFAPDALAQLRKHVIFVLDVSGSMYGQKLDQMKKAQNKILDDLKPDDFFDIVTFSSGVGTWKPEGGNRSIRSAYSATEINIDLAKTFINSLKANGMTNINDALMQSIHIVKSSNLPENVGSMIIFLTDGQPTRGEQNLYKILENIDRENSEQLSIPIFSLGFGRDVDFTFLKKLSLQNNGFARKIYDDSDAALQLKGFYNEIASPLLSGVSFNYTNPNVTDVTLSKFPTVFNGSEIAVAGKLNSRIICSSQNSSIVLKDERFMDNFANIHGMGRAGIVSFNRPRIICKTMDPPSNVLNNTSSRSEEDKFLERLWAYLTIQQLIKKDLADDKKENTMTEMESPKQHATRLALKYGFVTPFTSLVVVKPSKDDQNATITDTASVLNNKESSISEPSRQNSISSGTPVLWTSELSQTSSTSGSSHPSNSATSQSRNSLTSGILPSLPSGGGIGWRGRVPVMRGGGVSKTGSNTYLAPRYPGSGGFGSIFAKPAGVSNRGYDDGASLSIDTLGNTGKTSHGNQMSDVFKLRASVPTTTRAPRYYNQQCPITTPKNYTLADIKWINRDLTIELDGTPYTVANRTTVQHDSTVQRMCLASPGLQIFGKCVHLSECILKPFLDDLELFMRSYFCPIHTGWSTSSSFIGVCCTNGN